MNKHELNKEEKVKTSVYYQYLHLVCFVKCKFISNSF